MEHVCICMDGWGWGGYILHFASWIYFLLFLPSMAGDGGGGDNGDVGDDVVWFDIEASRCRAAMR